MATIRQIDANRSNAQKSTGPRTDAGKAISRHNAMKHGLAAALPHECLAELAELRATLTESWQPANAHELLAVELIAESWIRMQRTNRFEAEFFASEIENVKADLDLPTEPDAAHDDAYAAAILAAERHAHAVKMLDRYSQRATSKYFKAVAQLQKMQKERRSLEAAGQQKDREAGLASFRQMATATAMAAGAATTASAELASFGEISALPQTTQPGPGLASFCQTAAFAPEATASAAPEQSASFGQQPTSLPTSLCYLESSW